MEEDTWIVEERAPKSRASAIPVFGWYNYNMKTAEISEADILQHLTWPRDGTMEADAARALLRIKFDKIATKRIRELLRKNNRGIISAPERVALEKFLRVGKLVDLLHAKALLSLKEAGQSG